MAKAVTRKAGRPHGGRARRIEERRPRFRGWLSTDEEEVERRRAAFPGEFSLADVERASPGVSRDMVRRVLRRLQREGRVECIGLGPGARWRKRG